MKKALVRNDWSLEETMALLESPFSDLMFEAQKTHCEHFDPNHIQLSTLLNIKTGGCPEDCAYCPQSVHYDTGVAAEKLMRLEDVLQQVKAAKDKGAERFCMGAAWRQPRPADLEKVITMIKEIKKMGMETCVTLGFLSIEQAAVLKDAGLDYYNHNLDCSPEYYPRIITTRQYHQRLETLANVRGAGINICCGGIIGMGEGTEDRAGLLLTLANMPKQPESVPINMLVRVEGTPLGATAPPPSIDFVRVIAAARIMMPAAYVRLSAGRDNMTDEMQALCFLAGANSVFYGDKLLTTGNPETNSDRQLFRQLGVSFSRH